MSETRKRRAIFLGTGVSASVSDSVIVSTISCDASDLEMQKPMHSMMHCG